MTTATVFFDTLAYATLKQELRQDIDKRLAELKNELVKWLFGVSIAQTIIIISCTKLI